VAFSVRITGYSKETNEPSFVMEPPWWPESVLRQDPRFQASNGAGGYLDYDADLDVEEARELHEWFKPRATRGIYEYGGWQELVQPMLQELGLVFGSRAHEFSHFHVNVFEWESGLD
jgi:hypothetical protein